MCLVKIQCDSLKYVTLLERKGITEKSAKAHIELLTEMEIFNIYSVNEVDSMLSEAVNKVFEDRDKMLELRDKRFSESIKTNEKRFVEEVKANEKRLDELRHEFVESLRLQRQEMLDSRKEIRQEIITSRRWLVGTTITLGLSLAAYLTTLIKILH